MSYYEDELALREAQINKKRKRNRKRLLIGAGAVAGGALALNNEGIRNKVTNHLRSDSQMMNNIGSGVRKVGEGIYNNFKPSSTTMSIRRGAERAADAISNHTPKYNKRRRKLANIIDEIYHSGYSDGYYAGMELYHSDDSEMTDEERKARRKKKLKRYGNRIKYYNKSYWRALPAGLAIGTGIGALTGAYDANVFMKHSAMKYKRADDEDDFDYDKHMKRARRSGHFDGALVGIPVGYVGAMGVALRNPERRKKIISSMRRTGYEMGTSDFINSAADKFERMADRTDRFVNKFKRPHKKH